jgi:hypothetical protein
MKARQWTIRHRVWSMMGCGGVGLLLLAGMAWAAAPCPILLNTCITSLNTTTTQLNACNTSLGTCTSDLGTCQTDLDECNATQVVFPGDGTEQQAPLRYTNNNDGTVTDDSTKLMWEVKCGSVSTPANCGVRDVLNQYNWSNTGGPADGTLFSVFQRGLNNTCDGDGVMVCDGDAECTGIGSGLCGLAGFQDWRIPHIKELQSIVSYGEVTPAIDHLFPGPTADGVVVLANYWSFTTASFNEAQAWVVDFFTGIVINVDKGGALPHRARAVRDVRR